MTNPPQVLISVESVGSSTAPENVEGSAIRFKDPTNPLRVLIFLLSESFSSQAAYF